MSLRLLCTSTKDQYRQQVPEYHGRTELLKDGLTDRHVSLKIFNTRPSDEGPSHCSVTDGISYAEAILGLRVAGLGSAPQITFENYQDGGIRMKASFSFLTKAKTCFGGRTQHKTSQLDQPEISNPHYSREKPGQATSMMRKKRIPLGSCDKQMRLVVHDLVNTFLPSPCASGSNLHEEDTFLSVPDLQSPHRCLVFSHSSLLFIFANWNQPCLQLLDLISQSLPLWGKRSYCHATCPPT
ncbi:hypothetical protein Y1Q_0005911 [Alligator mississippiensis]|uniref:Uncharacterized protein n=1 Tax=Alligator mississippiensis TaxID=8496 RepID=A0A151MXR8_ALLMI|nr:hypothetical protein Y1Q_0005911 [Alligator mississippiensis]